MDFELKFTVIGRPQQRGSKVAGLIPKRGGGFVEKNGRPIVVARDANQNSKAWMDSCKLAAHQAFNGELLKGPIELRVSFYFNRPQSHYGTGNNASKIKPSAPEFHTQSPDLDKLVRCLGDALTGVVYVDDRQVFRTYSERNWTTRTECAVVTIIEVETTSARGKSNQSQLNLSLGPE